MTDEFKKPAQLRKLERKGHGKKKQKTVRQNVLHPMLITVSAINLVIVIFFNRAETQVAETVVQFIAVYIIYCQSVFRIVHN